MALGSMPGFDGLPATKSERDGVLLQIHIRRSLDVKILQGWPIASAQGSKDACS